jgi:fucose 4-O-acetylase-like acetyltransferase
VLFLISKIIPKKINNTIIPLLMATVFAVIGYAWYPFTNFRLPMAIDVAFTGVALYLIGFLLRRYNVITVVSNNKLIPLLLFAAGSVIGLFTTYISMRELVFGNIFLFYFNALVVSVAIISFSQIISPFLSKLRINKLILYLGKNTLLLLIFNHIVIYAFILIVTKILPDTAVVNTLLMVIRPWLVVLLICVFILIINRFFPFVIGRPYQIKSEGIY